MHSNIGPFAHLRNQTTIGTQSVIGNFVELSKSSVAQQTKIKHLSYIGNAQVGSHVNVGAGTIVCNYDGFTKHQTVIKDQVSIGSLNSLVAPVTIHERALTAAGSTITERCPCRCPRNRTIAADQLRKDTLLIGVRPKQPLLK